MNFIAGIVVIFLMMFAAPLLGVGFGGFAGWVVGLFFEDTIMTFLHAFGVDTIGLSTWQVGASLGFIGSFFRPITSFK